MRKILLRSAGSVMSLLFLLSAVSRAEEITVTTYYPSPNGSYDSLLSDKMAVGDTNADGNLNFSDIPTVGGRLFVRGTIAVGKIVPDPEVDWNNVSIDVGKFIIASDDSTASVMLGPAAGHSAIELRQLDNSGTPYIDFSNDDTVDYDARFILQDNSNLHLQGPGGGVNFVIGDANSSPARTLYVNGSIGCSGPQGSATKHVFDIAEIMPVEGDVLPGDVVVLAPGKERKLFRSKSAYDRLVMGIISSEDNSAGSTAVFLLGNKDEALKSTGRKHEFITVAGQVAVNVCLENGPIEPGDLLVTSSIPGYAMRGSDTKKMFGAVVAKAMERFGPENSQEGKGQIVALLALM